MTWRCDEVKKLDELLSGYLGSNKIITDVKTKQISEPGENYGSIIYKLDITIANKQNKNEEVLYTIAKVLPESDFIREMFRIQTTYKNEMAFYNVIVPTFINFQKELGIKDTIDCFAKCYAVRNNLLESSDVIDDDAVLIFENLKVLGYINIDKVKGFDLETAKMVIKDLAQFHGVSLALKSKKPKIFEQNIKAYCTDYYAEGAQPLAVPLIKLVTDENEETRNILSKINWQDFKRVPPKEPFATLIHDDVWTNNTMQKFENGKPVANKLVDFQVISYRSPATDLIFFLWSSVPLDVLKTHLDYFIKYYHDNLIDALNKYQIDIGPFSFDNFLKEIDDIAPFEFKHAGFFHLMAVHGKKGGFDDTSKMPTAEEAFGYVTDVAKEKTWFMVTEFNKRGWIK